MPLKIKNGKSVMCILICSIFTLVAILESGVAAPPPPGGDYGNYIGNVPDGVWVEYNFNEGSGTITRDDSGHAKTGNLVGAQFVNGPGASRDWSFSAVEFDGDNDHIVLNNANLPITNNFAVCGNFLSHVKPEEMRTQQGIDFQIIVDYWYNANWDPSGGSHMGFMICLVNGNLRAYLYDGTQWAGMFGTTGLTLSDGEWHFFALNYDYNNNQWQIYLDSTISSANLIVNGPSTVVVPPPPTANLYIGDGVMRTWDNFEFYGKIDDIHIYGNTDHRMWGNDNVGFWGFDDGGRLNPDPQVLEYTDYVNDRVTFDHHSYGTRVPGGLFGGPTWDTWNKIGGPMSLDFNGETDFVNIDHHETLDFANDNDPVDDHDEIYIELWFNTRSSNYQALVSKIQMGFPYNRGYVLSINSFTRGVTFQLLNGNSNFMNSVSINPSPSLNTWYHVWAYYDGTNMYLHVEDSSGTQLGSSSLAYNGGIGDTNEQPLWFGKTHGWIFNGHYTEWMDYGFFDGNIDEVIIGYTYPC